MGNSIETRVGELEKGMQETNKLFKFVFERLDSTEETLDSYIEAVSSKLPLNRKRIGIKVNSKD